MSAFYNENDAYAAQWLRNLIAAGQIAPGVVDERSITEISADELAGYDQCHFFAGIGIWSRALRNAGWPDDAPIWTGSCPCQPFSAAGQQKGFDDERHLWPHWFGLIAECRPAIVIGEQVASALAWLDLVQTDMEAAGYAFGAADLCAAGFPLEDWKESAAAEWLRGAIRDCSDPVVAGMLRDFADWSDRELGAHDGDHLRQRLYFVGVADADDARSQGWAGMPERADQRAVGARSMAGGLADADGGEAGTIQPGGEYGQQPQDDRASSGVADTGSQPSERRAGSFSGPQTSLDCARQLDGGGANRHSDGGEDCNADAPMLGRNAVDWLYCRDGKWRPVGPGTFPLADAAPARVGRLRAYGNGLDLETATQFAASVKDIYAGPWPRAAA